MELIQNREGLDATLTVKITSEDYASKVDKELKKARQTAQIKGFRPGNAPMSLIKKLYRQSIFADEINKLLVGSLENYEKENGEKIFGGIVPSENQPSINFETQKDFEFKYEVGFFPDFDYKLDENTELTYYHILVDDKAIDDEIEFLSNRYVTTKNVETAEEIDMISADTKIIKDDEEVVHNTKFLVTIVPDEYKPLFIGAKVGDEINVEIRKVFPNEIDLCGMLELDKEKLELQPETLTFTVTEVLRRFPSEINQDFFDKIAGKGIVNSEEEFREYLSERIEEEYDTISLDRFYVEAFNVVNAKANVLLPEDFIAKYLRHSQKPLENYTDEQFDYTVKSVIAETKAKFIVDSLLKQAEKFEITDDMIVNEARKVIRERVNIAYSDLYEQFTRQILNNQQEVQNIVWRIKNQKLALFMKEKSKLNVIDITFEDYQALYEQEHAGTEAGNLDEIAVTEKIATDDSEQINTENQEINKTEE
ncbi:MAG: hypothetical protein LBT50_00820 [Prevotellaceae bacterium]|nr:hypothetical protein [Prevotellaceae bacterium]